MLIFSTALAFISVAADWADRHHGALGCVAAITILLNGLMVCRSIWRDRL
ncbi:hypothetical protein ABIC65_001054 [Sphingomonas trueperi]